MEPRRLDALQLGDAVRIQPAVEDIDIRVPAVPVGEVVETRAGFSRQSG